jgi:hypothetical protein
MRRLADQLNAERAYTAATDLSSAKALWIDLSWKAYFTTQENSSDRTTETAVCSMTHIRNAVRLLKRKSVVLHRARSAYSCVQVGLSTQHQRSALASLLKFATQVLARFHINYVDKMGH